MVWSDTLRASFLLDCKLLAIKLSEVICRKSDLGQPIDGYLDMLYLICNVTFSMEEDSSIFLDDELDYFYSLYTKVLTQHNRYKGI